MISIEILSIETPLSTFFLQNDNKLTHNCQTLWRKNTLKSGGFQCFRRRSCHSENYRLLFIATTPIYTKRASYTAGSSSRTLGQYINTLHNKSYVGEVGAFGRQTQWWPRQKATYFSWLVPELFCLLLGPPGLNCWFSFASVFQWCCSTPQGSPGVGNNTLFLSIPYLYFIIVFIRDLFVSRDDPLMS